MGQVSILKGIYASSTARFVESYPINLEPQVVDNGISGGLLRSAPGITGLAAGPGLDRGAITWRDHCFRVMGNSLVRLTGSTVLNLGVMSGTTPVSLDYGFDRLAIASDGELFYWDGYLRQVTDPDLGLVIDVCWIDGYFMTTDGQHLVVTELNDPFSVNPLKYGSSEADPDPIVAVKRVRGEIYAVNTNTIENFQNVGGNGFPFERNPGGMIPKGAVGTHAVAYFLETLAFVGSGREEAVSVYLAGNGEAISISTPQVDRELAAVSMADLPNIETETRVEQNEQRFLIHLPTKTLVYYAQASRVAKAPVWTILASGAQADQPYIGRHFVLAEGRWVGGHTNSVEIGYLDETVTTQLGNVSGWQFDVALFYNAGKGGIIKALELAGLAGYAPAGLDPTAFLSITQDGRTWGTERAISLGSAGQRLKRMQWRPKIKFANYAGARFRGSNTGIASFARLEADLEGLNA